MTDDLNKVQRAFQGCEKIKTTPVPFALYQIGTMICYLFILSCPFVVASYNTSYFTAGFFCFVISVSFLGAMKMGKLLVLVQNGA